MHIRKHLLAFGTAAILASSGLQANGWGNMPWNGNTPWGGSNTPWRGGNTPWANAPGWNWNSHRGPRGRRNNDWFSWGSGSNNPWDHWAPWNNRNKYPWESDTWDELPWSGNRPWDRNGFDVPWSKDKARQKRRREYMEYLRDKRKNRFRGQRPPYPPPYGYGYGYPMRPASPMPPAQEQTPTPRPMPPAQEPIPTSRPMPPAQEPIPTPRPMPPAQEPIPTPRPMPPVQSQASPTAPTGDSTSSPTGQ